MTITETLKRIFGVDIEKKTLAALTINAIVNDINQPDYRLDANIARMRSYLQADNKKEYLFENLTNEFWLSSNFKITDVSKLITFRALDNTINVEIDKSTVKVNRKSTCGNPWEVFEIEVGDHLKWLILNSFSYVKLNKRIKRELKKCVNGKIKGHKQNIDSYKKVLADAGV
ncbi:hypothetical protein HNP86_001801 [Methanococcus maripaludis]|uniref:Uncharacterized protein n=1 Tax=Methanococcus maripaludis TaxID=39152 RepID=A0A7J9NVD4_METMI|nr:hypothetical protein [Methanococcus maripaludis]MBA2851642.1 hypothetical protein [Methanococcus maripaludis]